MIRTYRAYNGRGHLVLWTSAGIPATQAAEEEALQERLNRGELARVDVTSDDPREENYTMYPLERGK